MILAFDADCYLQQTPFIVDRQTDGQTHTFHFSIIDTRTQNYPISLTIFNSGSICLNFGRKVRVTSVLEMREGRIRIFLEVYLETGFLLGLEPEIRTHFHPFSTRNPGSSPTIYPCALGKKIFFPLSTRARTPLSLPIDHCFFKKHENQAHIMLNQRNFCPTRDFLFFTTKTTTTTIHGRRCKSRVNVYSCKRRHVASKSKVRLQRSRVWDFA